jgi:hypothetical protein
MAPDASEYQSLLNNITFLQTTGCYSLSFDGYQQGYALILLPNPLTE